MGASGPFEEELESLYCRKIATADDIINLMRHHLQNRISATILFKKTAAPVLSPVTKHQNSYHYFLLLASLSNIPELWPLQWEWTKMLLGYNSKHLLHWWSANCKCNLIIARALQFSPASHTPHKY